MRPSIDGWQTCLDPDSGSTYLEHRSGAQIITFRPGAPVAVSTDGGRSWTHGTLPVRSIYSATIAADVILMRARHARAAAATSGGMSARDRQLAPSVREAERTERRAAAQARGARPQVRGALRRGNEGARGGDLRRSEEAPPPWVRFDDPTAIALARRHVAGLRPSVAGQGQGNGTFFAAAVAIVRGFCLLPETGGAAVLADYAKASSPPWSPADQRRALTNAQRAGAMPWAVLLSLTAEGRALVGSWRGKGARGKGADHG